MLTIPYEKGWQADTQSVKIQNYRGFIGIKVPKKATTFTLTYHTPGIPLGWLVTIMGLIGLAALILYEYHPRFRKRMMTGSQPKSR